jgi:hypothetical protein
VRAAGAEDRRADGRAAQPGRAALGVVGEGVGIEVLVGLVHGVRTHRGGTCSKTWNAVGILL